MSTVLYMAIPCYNEEAVLEETSKRLKEKYQKLIDQGKISRKSRIVYINDGSTDQSWQMIKARHEADHLFSGLNLSRNQGHQNALLAGLLTIKSEADCVISMDADLQDDIELIDQMLEQFEAGYDVVYGVRDNRATDTAFKRNTAGLFYKLMKNLGSDAIPNAADFRLMSARALDALEQFPEVNLFLRGLVPLIGFKSTQVYYKRDERFAGESKYPLKKMINFAMDGITSTSARPMRLILWLGLIIFFVAIVLGIYVIVSHFNGSGHVRGWASTITLILALGGIQLFAIGVIGEYIGKIFLEVKHRPRFIIEEFLNEKE